jgi:hypothetical protein
MIRPFSFIDYVSKDWLSPTNSLFREFGDGSDYAGSDAVSKVPLLFHFDQDWAFLSQFPPTYWKQALHWRYNTGLLQASQAREEHPNKHVNAIKDWAPEVVLGKRGKEIHFTGLEGKGIYTGYNKMFTEFEKPVKRDTGYKAGVDYGYQPLANTSEDGPPLRNVDVFAKTPNDVRHHNGETHYHANDYKDGKIGMDLSRPQIIDNEFIDSLPDDDPFLAKIKGGGTAAEKKAKLKEEPPHSLAGMPVMRDKQAAEMIQTWIRAQGLGLLGELKAGDKVPDPLTKGELTITQTSSPKSILESWPASVGKNKGQWTTPNGQQVIGQEKPLNVPVINRTIHYYTVDESGNKLPQSKTYQMPVLLTTTILPKFQLTDQQRQQFADRTENKAQKSGAVTDVDNLLKNWDLLAPEQIKDLKDNQLTQLQVLARQDHKKDFDKKYPNHRAAEYYTIGMNVNKASKGLFPHNLSSEQMQKVAEEYFPEDSKKLQHTPKYPCATKKGDTTHLPGCNGGGLQGEAYEGIVDYMKDNLGYNPSRGGSFVKNNPKAGVLQMMEGALPQLIDFAASQLVARLNDAEMGIYDPDLGLTGLSPDLINKPESARHRRISWVKRFARELEQASLLDTKYGTRRIRNKMGSMGMGQGHELSYDKIGGDEEETGGGNLGNEKEFAHQKAAWQRGDDSDEPESGTPSRTPHGTPGTPGNRTWKAASDESVARPGSLLPKISYYTDKLFQPLRNTIGEKISPEYKKYADDLKNALKRLPSIKETMLEEKERELASKIADPVKRREQAERDVDENFTPEELKKRFPDMYVSIKPSDLKDAVGAARHYGKYAAKPGDKDEEGPTNQDDVTEGGVPRKTMNQLLDNNIDFVEKLLKYGSGDMYGIEKHKETKDLVVQMVAENLTIQELSKEIATPESLKVFIENDLKLGRKGANDYFVKLWMALSEEQKNPITQQQAITIAQKLQLSPTEVTQKELAQQPIPINQQQQQQPQQTRTAAMNVRDLVDYIYEPEQPGENKQQIVSKIRNWLGGIDAAYKPSLKSYYDKLMARMNQQPKLSEKDHLVIQLIGDFLEDEPAKI